MFYSANIIITFDVEYRVYHQLDGDLLYWKCEMHSTEEPKTESSKDLLRKKKRNNFQAKVLAGVYLNEKTADVHFICGASGVRILAHKYILSETSPYFNKMFYGPNATDCDKDFSKWSPDAFKDFLKLCYLSEVSGHWSQ